MSVFPDKRKLSLSRDFFLRDDIMQKLFKNINDNFIPRGKPAVRKNKACGRGRR